MSLYTIYLFIWSRFCDIFVVAMSTPAVFIDDYLVIGYNPEFVS